VKYAFIATEEAHYPREILCHVMGVSPSGFASWKRGPTRRKWLTDTQLLTLIRAIHRRVKGAYGSPRIFGELKDAGYPVSCTRVERLMADNGIRARHKRRYKATTDSKHAFPVAENLLDRQFNPSSPGTVYSADITFIATDEGWLYLAIVLDLFDRSVVGWAMKDRMKTDLVSDALRMAWFRRRPASGAMHHSDRGSQYASHEFQALLTQFGMTCSMSRKGNCWDNAPTESFFNSLKNERVHGTRYGTREQAKADLFEYIELFYNRSRRHSALGGKSPAIVYGDWVMQQKLAA
jgi:putative transposase